MALDLTESELPQALDLDSLGAAESVVEIVAGEAERAALARRFGLAGIGDLRATVRVRRAATGVVGLSARIAADVVQTCVVTLEPVSAHIDRDIEMALAPAGDHGGEVVVGLEDDDGPEPLEGDSIAIGEIVAQHFGLALDPYPRREGAVFEGSGPPAPAGAGDPGESPFAVLRGLGPKAPTKAPPKAPIG